MRERIVPAVLTMAFLAVALTVAGQSADLLLGTWRRNNAKSIYSPGPTPALGAVNTWEALGDGRVKNSLDDIDEKGQKTNHREITLRFDGAEYPYSGPALPTMRSYKRIDARTFEWVEKVNGKVTTTTRSTITPDGKTRTNNTTGTNPQGQTIRNVVIWEKQ